MKSTNPTRNPNELFVRVPQKGAKRNMFHRPHNHPTTFKMGWIVPYNWEATLPGETWFLRTSVGMRFLPLYFPIMADIEIDLYWFYCPNRILYDNQDTSRWENFIMGKEDPEWAYCDLSAGAQGGAITSLNESSVACYLGIPTTGIASVTDPQHVSALPGAVYGKLWDHYFRSSQLQDEVADSRLIGGENTWVNDILFSLPLKANWKHDYFTAALPEAVAGEDILVPLMDEDKLIPENLRLQRADVGGNPPAAGINIDSTGIVRSDTGSVRLGVEPTTFNENAAKIRTLRLHLVLQEWFEKANRIGDKYRDFIRGRFGLDPRAGIIDEPVYIGHAKGHVTISDVMQTAETVESDTVTSPTGSYSGQAIAVTGSRPFKFFSPEHGIIMQMAVVRPQAGYGQGIGREWFRETYMDYPFPEFAHIGDQPIMNKEIFWDWTDNNPTLHDAEFGYQPRYAEYRWKNNTLSGKMRTDFRDWHLYQWYDTRPELNSDFIACTPRADDVFTMATNEEHEIFALFKSHNKALRPLPVFGNPGI